MRVLIFIVLIVLSSAGHVFAKHIAGGDFYSTWLNGNNFKLTLKLYRDCSDPSGSPFDQSITMGIFNKQTNVLVNSYEVNLGAVIDLTLAGNLCSPPPEVCMQQGTYELNVALPANATGYYVVWERCCRNANIVNLNAPSQAAMAFYLEIPNPALHNSSPVFLNAPLPYMCITQPWNYNFNVVDPDGDSLVSYLSTPLDGGHTSSSNPNPFSLAIPTGGGGQTPVSGPYASVTWASGYGLANIVDGAPTLSINNSTGLLTCTPSSLGMYAMAVVTEEYRNGVLIGKVRREIEFYVINCNQNTLPSIAPNIAPGPGSSYNVYAGDTLSLTLTISDPEDSLYITHQGDPFIGGTAVSPFATTQDTSVLLNVKLNFDWPTTCAHIGNSPYHVKYTVTDNGCPLPKVRYFDFDVNVIPPPQASPVNLLCMKFITDDIVEVYFGDTNSIAAKYFKYYQIYRSANGSPFTLIGTINQTGLDHFTDSTALNAKTIDYCYYLVGVNSCDFSGPPSDTLCSLAALNHKTNYVATTSVAGPNNITVEWEHFPDGPFSTFYVYRKENNQNLNYALYNTLLNPTTDFTNDLNVTTSEKSYCYYLVNEDYCENKSPESNIGCSILLTGTAAPYVNFVQWTPYEKWNGDVAKYELWRKIDDQSPYVLIATLNKNQLSFIDDKLDLAGGRFYYKIIAYEGSGSLGKTSISNEIILVQSPQVFIPNAFTPNEDSYNETWYPKSTFVNDFDLYIYNRWGQLIFESHNELDQWKGSYNGKPCQEGLYYYVLKYTGYDNNNTYSKTGSITLVR